MNDVSSLFIDTDDDVQGATSRASYARKQRDTLDTARAKVLRNIEANIQTLQGVEPVRTPNKLYRQLPSGKFQVGIKYGNAWLNSSIRTSNGVVKCLHVAENKLIATLTQLKQQVEAGLADEEIQKLMDLNVSYHTK